MKCQDVFNMATFIQYGRHGLLLNTFCIEMAAVSQEKMSWWQILYFDNSEWRFNVISSIKTFKYFQNGYSFSGSLPRAIPEYCF